MMHRTVLASNIFHATFFYSPILYSTYTCSPLCCSKFSDVFDELHFIRSLQGDVRIVKELPGELVSLPHARKHFTSWSGMGYFEEMKQIWKDHQACYHQISMLEGHM